MIKACAKTRECEALITQIGWCEEEYEKIGIEIRKINDPEELLVLANKAKEKRLTIEGLKKEKLRINPCPDCPLAKE